MGFLDTVKNRINPTSLESFGANIGKHGGLAVQNRFAVIMTPPQASLLNFDLQGSVSSLLSGTFSLGSLINDPRDVALLCESCSSPLPSNQKKKQGGCAPCQVGHLCW